MSKVFITGLGFITSIGNDIATVTQNLRELKHGIEVYAVCARRPIKVDEKEREKAEGELAQKEFEIVAKRYLRDLRQDAHIEYR